MITSHGAFVVEVWGKPVGVVIADGRAFRFKALTRPFFAMDDKKFPRTQHQQLRPREGEASSVCRRLARTAMRRLIELVC